MAHNTPVQISDFETEPCPSEKFHSNRARYPGNSRFDPKSEITIELQKIYMVVRGKKIGKLLQRRKRIFFLIQ